MGIIRDDNDINERMDQLSAAADVVTKLSAGLGIAPEAPRVPRERLAEALAPAQPPRRSLGGMEIVAMAKEQIIAVTGLTANTVSGLYKDDHGWHVVIDMVELRRIPNSSDVLATYDVVLDGDGNLLTYRRTRRYLRGAVVEGEM